MSALYLFMYLSFNLPVINSSCFQEQYTLLTIEEVYAIRNNIELQEAYKLYVRKHCI